MAAPLVVSVSPAADETDVLLGTSLILEFDQEIDPATVTESTLSLTGPGSTNILTPEQLIAQQPAALTGREYLTGTFEFSLVEGRSVVRFNPTAPLQKDTVYKVLLLGGSNALLPDAIKNLDGDAMAASYEWVFTTGHLQVDLPPLPPPPLSQAPAIDPKDIVVIPRKPIGNNLATQIDLIFPDELVPNSVDVSAILVAIEPILGDLGVVVPEGLTPMVTITGRTISIVITGW